MNNLLSVREQVTHADTGSYRVYPFDVPAGTTALDLDFQVEPAEVGEYAQAVKVVLMGPDGLHGTLGRRPGPARLTPRSASLGFVAGPLTPGTWHAEVSLEYVLDGSPCSYLLTVRVETDEEIVPATAERPTRFDGVFPTAATGRGGPGWYAGDLHMHTIHSDGQWSPAELLQAVRRRGLDFFVLTDHNIKWAIPDLAAELVAQDAGSILAIPGVEVSTRCGHLLAIGAETWIDWRLGHWPDRPALTIAEIVRRVHEAGALAIIAHPGAIGSPYCHGCAWELNEVDPATIDAVEVWNGPWLSEPEENAQSLSYWEAWRARGYNHPLTGGSDAHGGQPDFKEGVPTTYVYASDLTRTAIMEGLRAGRVVVSSGPILHFQAARGATALCGPGETFSISANDRANLVATVSGLGEPARLIVRGHGGIVAEQTIERQGTLAMGASRLVPGWYLAEVRSVQTSAMLAIANPITFLA